MQKMVRGHLARKRHGPRINGIRKTKALETKVKQLEDIAGQLKKDKEGSIKTINSVKNEIEAAIKRIKVKQNCSNKNTSHMKSLQREEAIDSSTIEGLYNQLLEKLNNQMNLLRQKVQEQKNAEEQARLRKIQEEMEAEKRRKEEEERKAKEEEEIRKKKAEIEARRKREEEERKKQVCILKAHDSENFRFIILLFI